MTDNIDVIEPLLVFPSDDIFYTLLVIKRKKDGNPELTASQISVLTKTIRSVEGLRKVYPDVCKMADAVNGRVYINLNAKSARKCTTAILRQACQDVDDEQFTPHRLFDKAAGKLKSCLEPRWIVDMDRDPETDRYHNARTVLASIPAKCLLARVPTVNGYHLITTGFDPRPLTELGIDVHKNNPTLLYFGGSKYTNP